MLLMIDNYDSFTYNLVQYLGELGQDIRVFRNDKVSVREIEKLKPERIVISPGPCTPKEAGISVSVIQHFAGKIPILGVCLGHQCVYEVFGGSVEAAGETEAEPAAEGEEGESGEPAVDPAAQVEQLEAEVVAMAEDLGTSVVDFINSDPPIQGEPFNEFQMFAIRLKSAEDMVVADEYISQGGDYRRAIRIYEDALLVDPDNGELQARLASSQELRYMTEERFALATKDMAQAQVREVLGQVNLRNIREYEDKGVIAWFYPTSETGEAAAVWFQPDKKTEVMTVYQVKFEAVKPGQSEEE